MNNKTTSWLFLVIASAMFLAACGGSSGGGGGGSGGGSTAGTFEKEVAPAVTGPFWGLFSHLNNIHTQLLFPANEIKGSGYITAIKLRYGADLPVVINCPETFIRLGHTSANPLAINFASNVEQGKGSLQVVHGPSTVSIPAGMTGDYLTINFSTPFYYNGVDNLVLDVTRTQLCNFSFSEEFTGSLPAGIAIYTNTTSDANGSLLTGRPNMTFVFAGGVNEQDFGAGTTNFWPFSNETPRVQSLYLASEINGKGVITGIAFQLSSMSAQQTYTATVRMGHTTLTTLNDIYASNYNAAPPVIVADTVSFTVPAGIPADGWFWVPLPDSTFEYNGTDNLIIDTTVTAGSGNTTLVADNIAGRRSSGMDNAAPAGDGVDDFIYHVKLRFKGSSMDVITAGNNPGRPPFDDQDNRIQMLFGPSDMGSAGNINKIAFRLDADSIAASYPSFEVVLAQTANASLDSTFANNLAGAMTVYSGTFQVPAGLKAGDWVEVPFSTAFTYDPSMFLVVETKGLAGTDFNNVRGETDATRYPSHLAITQGAGANVSVMATSNFDAQVDGRFWFSQ